MHDDELDRFKRDINLVEFAIDHFGYTRLRRESSRSSHVLHHDATHDKILVARDEDRHWIYCSVRDERDNGTVIDFIQRRRALDLGRTRQELRAWLHTPRPDPGPVRRPESPPVTRDRKAVALAFAAAASASNNDYLNARGIRPQTLQDPRFAKCWKVDRRGNVLFPHRDAEGLCGFEIKNDGFTGFAAGGSKALWHSAKPEGLRTVVLCESAIDALSYQQLHRLPHALFLSTAGALSRRQIEQIDRLFGRLPSQSLVIAAVDSDLGGRVISAQLEPLATAHALEYALNSPPPAAGKDWNEVLQRLERDLIRERGPARPLEQARAR